MMTDPIADLLTQIRNANRIERPAVDVPSTRMKQRVVQVLKDEGFVLDYQVGKIDRASRPGLRLYRRCDQLAPVLDGLGISVLSTSKGIMSDRQARAQRLGGELLCTVW